MFIPGPLIALATFPGVVAHEYAHERACRKRDLVVVDVCYFQLGTPNGYVEHEEPREYADAFWISVAPFAFNTIGAIALAAAAVGLVGLQTVFGPGLFELTATIAGWVGASFAWHAIPSKHDAQNVWRHARREWRSSWFAALGLPIVVVLYICHYLSYVWFDAVYAAVVVFGTVFILREPGVVFGYLF